MKRIIEWMADNSVAANLLMILIIVGGAYSLFTLKLEVFPEIDLGGLAERLRHAAKGQELYD